MRSKLRGKEAREVTLFIGRHRIAVLTETHLFSPSQDSDLARTYTYSTSTSNTSQPMGPNIKGPGWRGIFHTAYIVFQPNLFLPWHQPFDVTKFVRNNLCRLQSMLPNMYICTYLGMLMLGPCLAAKFTSRFPYTQSKFTTFILTSI